MASWLNRVSAATYRGFFGFWAQRRPPQKRPIQLHPSSRILAFTCAGIGDTLTDSVVFKALRETYPAAHLAAVVHRRRRLLVEHNPHLNHVFHFHKGPLAFVQLARQLRAAGPWDAIIHLRGNDPEPRCLSYLVDPDVTVSTPNMTKLGWLCGHTVEQPDWDETHGVEQTLRLARYLGADTPEPHLVYAVRDEEKRALAAQLPTLCGPDFRPERPRLVLQLGGGRRASWRDWPVVRYAELLELIHQNWGNAVETFVLGGPDQAERAAELTQLLAGKKAAKIYHEVVGKFSLAESAALLASARQLVSTDTGIMHLGFAVGTRVVALIHCNNPQHRVGPFGYGDRHRVVQLPKPAGYRTPADANMADLTAPQVFAVMQEIWP